MAIQIKKTFELHAPIEQVWTFITDPYQVVGCLPGAAITEKTDERTYKGTIKVKVGPMTIFTLMVPFVDHFASCHNLESLERVIEHLRV